MIILFFPADERNSQHRGWLFQLDPQLRFELKAQLSIIEVGAADAGGILAEHFQRADHVHAQVRHTVHFSEGALTDHVFYAVFI